MQLKQHHLIFSIMVVLITVLAFVFIVNPQSLVYAAVPEVPTNVQGVAGDTEATISWDAPSSGDTPTGYIIRYYITPLDIQEFDTGSTQTSHTLTGLKNGSSYIIQVAAYNADGTGTFTDPNVSVTPVASEVEPDAPVISGTAGDGQVRVSWETPNAYGGTISGYTLTYTPGGGTPTNVNLAADATSYTITGLANDVLVVVWLTADNEFGTSDRSNMAIVTPTAPEFSNPGVPNVTSTTAGNEQIVVNWTAPTDTGGVDLSGYTLRYTPEGGSATEVDLAADATSYTITELTNGVEYTINLVAVNVEDLSSSATTDTATPFTTPSAPTSVTLTPGDGTIGVSWSLPSSNGSPITDYVVAYRKNGGAEQEVTLGGITRSYTLEGLENGVDYTVRVRAENAAGFGSHSTTFTAAPDEDSTPSIVGSPSITISNRSAVVSWSTSKRASTQLQFGLVSLGASSSETNTTTRVSSHTVNLEDLVPCTTYSYRVVSRDASDNTIQSNTQEFTTTGCEGEAPVLASERNIVDRVTGGEIDFTNSEVKARLGVPSGVVNDAEVDDVIFQAKKLDRNSLENSLSVPDRSLRWLGTHAYKLSAYSSESQEIDAFDNDVSVTIEYTRDDIESIDLSSLKIYHYKESGGDDWHVLTNCENSYDPSTGTGEITCLTPDFSIFGLFGESSNQTSTGTYIGGSSSSSTSNDEEYVEITGSVEEATEEVVTEEVDEVVENVVNEESDGEEGMVGLESDFNQDLWWGSNNSDVLNLQKFLNANGFILADEGPGSPGRETSFFGEKTFNAVKAFQEMYAGSVLQPLGLSSPTGYFGYFTRAFINENF